jgi:2-polyprenyl-3-methyl-5-hydroxy-6-metoxy-1,4-benzoquinol methylase
MSTQPGQEAVLWLERPDGRVSITEQKDGRRLVRVHPAHGTFVSRAECTTRYPVSLIEQIFETKSSGYLCDEIARDEDSDYVESFLRYSLLGYLPPEAFRGQRMLDFGSGSGASTVVLARMFPETEIVGVELERGLIEIAEMRAKHYGLSNLVFLQSPTPEELPEGIGMFHSINLGAVYEHLLPAERRRLLAQLWSVLGVGGVIFVNQLPYRFYPIEAHTTGLPLINYLPDRLAHAAAKRFSPRVRADATWAELLRDGIRGGTARSVRGDLLRRGGEARMLTPKLMALRDHADLWYGYSSSARAHPIKRVMRTSFRVASRLTGSPIAPGLSLAFEKLA